MLPYGLSSLVISFIITEWTPIHIGKWLTKTDIKINVGKKVKCEQKINIYFVYKETKIVWHAGAIPRNVLMMPLKMSVCTFCKGLFTQIFMLWDLSCQPTLCFYSFNNSQHYIRWKITIKDMSQRLIGSAQGLVMTYKHWQTACH